MHDIASGCRCSEVNPNGMMAKSISCMRSNGQHRDERVLEVATGATLTKNSKLMSVLAHPDVETFGTGGILAKHAADGS